MKYIKIFIGLFLAVFILSFIPAKKSEKVVITTVIYCNHCEHCDTCKPQIIMALENVDGVKSAELNVEEQQITVWYNPKKIDVEGIRNAVIMAGYAADGRAPDADAYQKLEDCCKEGHEGHNDHDDH